MMKTHRGRELVGFYSFEAFERIMNELETEWEEPTRAFIAAAHKALLDELEKVSCKVVPNTISGLHSVVDDIMRDAMTTQLAAVRKQVRGLMGLEKRKAIVNDYYVDTIQKLRSKRFQVRFLCSMPMLNKLLTHLHLFWQKAIDAILPPDSDKELTHQQANIMVTSVFKKLTKVRLYRSPARDPSARFQRISQLD
jgi:hypothetical protein